MGWVEIPITVAELLTCKVWPIPLFILATLAPESPFYLVRAGRLEDAERSVARLAKRGAKTQPEQIVAMMVGSWPPDA